MRSRWLCSARSPRPSSPLRPAGASPIATDRQEEGRRRPPASSPRPSSWRAPTTPSATRRSAPRASSPTAAASSTDPAPANGQGVYPNSYERLGVQHGYHINGTLVDVARRPAHRTRRSLVQAICGSKPGNITPPHRTTFVDPGETKTLTMSCGKRKLMGGGYQRTTGRSKDGNMITESHAVGNAWQVTSHGQGKFGGELTGIAYCLKGTGGGLVTEVTGTVPIGTGETATATTGRLPRRPPHRLRRLQGRRRRLGHVLRRLRHHGRHLGRDGLQHRRAQHTSRPTRTASGRSTSSARHLLDDRVASARGCGRRGGRSAARPSSGR